MFFKNSAVMFILVNSCNELRLSIYIICINGKIESITGKPEIRAVYLQTKFTIPEAMPETIFQTPL